MKTTAKILVAIAVLLVCSCQKKNDSQLIPITSSSEKAIELYQQAYKAMIEIDVDQVSDLIKQALQEDPAFFMGKYLNLVREINFGGDTAVIKNLASGLVNTTGDLSDGEKLLQKITEMQLNDHHADISALAKELINKYPKDFWGYYELGVYQETVLKDYAAEIETFKAAAEKSNNPAISYNFLGYAYLSNNQLEEAGIAFDKYIELQPNVANAYNSKADYFMAAKDYQNAYEYFMKAHDMDSLTFGTKQAEKAKMMIDSTQISPKL